MTLAHRVATEADIPALVALGMRGMLIAAASAVKLDGSQIGSETGVLLQATLSKQLFCIQIT